MCIEMADDDDASSSCMGRQYAASSKKKELMLQQRRYFPNYTLIHNFRDIRLTRDMDELFCFPHCTHDAYLKPYI
jgi:hypothetical protein